MPTRMWYFCSSVARKWQINYTWRVHCFSFDAIAAKANYVCVFLRANWIRNSAKRQTVAFNYDALTERVKLCVSSVGGFIKTAFAEDDHIHRKHVYTFNRKTKHKNNIFEKSRNYIVIEMKIVRQFCYSKSQTKRGNATKKKRNRSKGNELWTHKTKWALASCVANAMIAACTPNACNHLFTSMAIESEPTQNRWDFFCFCERSLSLSLCAFSFHRLTLFISSLKCEALCAFAVSKRMNWRNDTLAHERPRTRTNHFCRLHERKKRQKNEMNEKKNQEEKKWKRWTRKI